MTRLGFLRNWIDISPRGAGGNRLGVRLGAAQLEGVLGSRSSVRDSELHSALLGISPGIGSGLAQLRLGLGLDLALGQAESQAG